MTAAAADEAWIENSLARLEQLEAQREQLASSGQTDKLAELDEEIRSLYEVLESVAGDDGGDAEPANAGVAAVAAAPVAAAPMAAAPMAQPGMEQPMGQPGMGQPMGGPGMGGPGMGGPGMDAAPSYDGLDDDIKPPRSPALFVVLGLLVVGGGVGAYMFTQGKKEAPPPAAATTPATIIKAGPVAEDTQEPTVAKGAEGDRTRGTNFKEGAKPTSSKPRRSGGGGGSRRSKKQDDGRKIKVTNTNDPLAGVD